MINLVYISAATKDFTEQELLRLLEQSRERNKTMNITGMLLYDQGTFLQVLEGEEKSVMEIYTSILMDDRNTGNYIVEQKEIQSRNFPTWSMGYKNLSDHDQNNVPGYTGFLSDNLSPTDIAKKSDTIVRLLFSFKTQTN